MAYDPALFALSLIVAHLLATTALYVRFRLARGMQGPVLVSTAALVLGGAVAAMHYTAMEAATFHAGTGQLGGQTALPSVVLAGAVCVLVLLTLGLTILSTVVHTRLTSVSVSLAEGARRHATVLQTMADGLLTFDADGRIESTNPASQRIFG